MTKSYDVIVIGGGSVGNPTACFLAQEGLKVLCLERRPAVGQGDHKAAIGGVRATHSDPGKITTCLESLKIFTTWEEKYGYSLDWKPGGYCFPVYDEERETTLKSILPTQKEFGLNIDWVSPDKVMELVPGIREEGLRGGTYSPEDGQISPLRAAVGMYREAVRAGAEYRFNERVTGYLQKGDRVIGVKTDKGEYSADKVVLAAGADASEHGDWLGFDLPVVPDSHEAGITAPVEHFLAPLVVDLRPGPEGKTSNFYFGQEAHGQIIFCYTPAKLFPGTNREPLSEFLPIICNRLVSLVPRFANLLIRRTWRGCYPMTPDGIPIIDWAPVEGLVLAVGMCGQGFMMGPGVARNVTSMVVKGEPFLSEEAQACFRYDRNFYAGKKEALK